MGSQTCSQEKQSFKDHTALSLLFSHNECLKVNSVAKQYAMLIAFSNSWIQLVQVTSRRWLKLKFVACDDFGKSCCTPFAKLGEQKK